mmetsp:Transcript_28159/g.51498  ORF Transcript_28159/g.51498 Transcript_28159/m.51498 type:complete len:415 (+) Transcript_28159:45-1289(+)
MAALTRCLICLVLGVTASMYVDMAKPIGTMEEICPTTYQTNETNMTEEWAKKSQGQIYEYVSNANPKMSQIPVWIFPPSLHESGPTRVIPFDLSSQLEVPYPATAPNLMASFLRIVTGEVLETSTEVATSETFYVIRGRGTTWTPAGEVHWEAGDLLAMPFLGKLDPICQGDRNQCLRHSCQEADRDGGCALYWVHDEPLMRFLGAKPSAANQRFEATLFRGKDVLDVVGRLPQVDANGKPKNRRGVLLGNTATPQTKTLTPTLWSLLNCINANQTQKAHKHNSVALDFAKDGGEPGTVYTKMGRSLDMNGDIVDPISVEWKSGGVFVTPPGWWHSHHNVGKRDAWVLPVQDAGIYTHQRTLDIRFAEEETERLRSQISRGATNSWEGKPVIAGTMSVGAHVLPEASSEKEAVM